MLCIPSYLMHVQMVRKSELIEASWDEIDFDDCVKSVKRKIRIFHFLRLDENREKNTIYMAITNKKITLE